MKSPKKSTEQNPSKASKAAANGNQENSNGDADAAATSMDAVTLIKNDHRKVEALFEQFESASSEDKKGWDWGVHVRHVGVQRGVLRSLSLHRRADYFRGNP